MRSKRPHHLTITLAVFALCAALLLAACGSDDDSDSTGTESTDSGAVTAIAPDSGTGDAAPGANPATGANAPDVPAASGGGAAPAPPAPPANLNKRLAVPDVAGDSLADAQSKIKAAGLVFTAESTDGDRSAIESSWEVCSTVPRAGKKIAAGAPVAVIAAPSGSC